MESGISGRLIRWLRVPILSLVTLTVVTGWAPLAPAASLTWGQNVELAYTLGAGQGMTNAWAINKKNQVAGVTNWSLVNENFFKAGTLSNGTLNLGQQQRGENGNSPVVALNDNGEFIAVYVAPAGSRVVRYRLGNVAGANLILQAPQTAPFKASVPESVGRNNTYALLNYGNPADDSAWLWITVGTFGPSGFSWSYPSFHYDQLPRNNGGAARPFASGIGLNNKNWFVEAHDAGSGIINYRIGQITDSVISFWTVSQPLTNVGCDPQSVKVALTDDYLVIISYVCEGRTRANYIFGHMALGVIPIISAGDIPIGVNNLVNDTRAYGYSLSTNGTDLILSTNRRREDGLRIGFGAGYTQGLVKFP